MTATVFISHDEGLISAAYSIIFVHGLFGHPQKTWTAKRSEGASNTIYWPKDLLPTVIPDSKVYTFGYDADVDNFFSAAGQNTIHQHTRTLLEDLADLLAEVS